MTGFSNRVGLNTDQDTFVYLTDDAGRLVEECHNRFCVHHERVWKQGSWDRVTFDREDQVLRLIELDDDFAGNVFHNQRWTMTTRRQQGYDQAPTLELNNVGLEVRQDQGLHIAYPRGYVSNTGAHQAAVHDYIGQDCALLGHYFRTNAGGLDASSVDSFFVELRHAEKLVGDFDIAVDYEKMQTHSYNFHLSLGICTGFVAAGTPPTFGGNQFYVIDLNGAAQVQGQTWNSGGWGGGLYNMGTSGQLRMTRTGSSLAVFHRDTDLDSWTSIATTSGPSSAANLYLAFRYDSGEVAEITVKNFRHLDSKTHAARGFFESPIYDAGSVMSWDRLQWVEDVPVGCDVELEVRVADDWAEFENFASPPVWFGPTGPGSKFTTASGQNMPRPVTGRYAQIRATLTGTTTATPSLSDIQFECNRASAVESRVIRYRFDEAGNILEVVTDTRYGRRSDKRDDPSWDPEERLNTLNQIMRQDIDGDSWDFTWDANGNLTSKTNGTESYTYVWNEDNRLTQVSWDGAVGGYHAARFHSGRYHAATGTATQWTVDYTYDSAGRMLTRDDNNGNVTKFYWDGWDMVRETTGSSTTEYLIPQGMLLSFKRDGVIYHASCDALGSVRLVTDEEGEVVSRLDYGAYGELLAGSFDGVPGGMPYTWVGALGVRRDALTGLYYMRQRWYTPTLQRFLNRDPLGIVGGVNLYAYIKGSPVSRVDPFGTSPWRRIWRIYALIKDGNAKKVGEIMYTICDREEKLLEAEKMLKKAEKEANLINPRNAPGLTLEIHGGSEKDIEEVSAALSTNGKAVMHNTPGKFGGFLQGGEKHGHPEEGIWSMSGSTRLHVQGIPPIIIGGAGIMFFFPSAFELNDLTNQCPEVRYSVLDYAGAIIWDVVSFVDPTPTADAINFANDI